jgi:hypothetical protein
MTVKLIVGDAIIKSLKQFAGLYRKTHDLAMLLGISCLAHAAQHGDCDQLNTFFNVLDTNHKDAFRGFVRRSFAIVGGWDGVTTVPQEQMETYKRIGAFLKFADKKFTIIRNDDSETAAAAKKQFMKLVPDMLAPDGKRFRHFMDRNNFAESKLFGMDELRQTVARIDKTLKGDRKNTSVGEIPADVLAAFNAFKNAVGEPTAAAIQ